LLGYKKIRKNSFDIIKIVNLFQPSRVLPHPEYKKTSRFDNDVALLLFDKPGFNLSSLVLPICLWNEDFDFSRIAGATGEVKIK